MHHNTWVPGNWNFTHTHCFAHIAQHSAWGNNRGTPKHSCCVLEFVNPDEQNTIKEALSFKIHNLDSANIDFLIP